MAIAVSVAGFAFAAFCVWLGVRIFNRRERWAKWTLAGVVAVPALYVASFGPACWIVSRGNMSGQIVTIPYRPIVWLLKTAPNPIRRGLFWYSNAGARDSWGWVSYTMSDGTVQSEWGDDEGHLRMDDF